MRFGGVFDLVQTISYLQVSLNCSHDTVYRNQEHHDSQTGEDGRSNDAP